MQKDVCAQVFFSPLQTRNVKARQQFLQDLQDIFSQDVNHNHTKLEEEIDVYYPVLLRLSHECPFDDVRECTTKILSNLESRGIRIPRRKFVGPSRFISEFECASTDTAGATNDLLVEAFLMYGRTSHIKQLLAYHTNYLSCYARFENRLMNDDGPLPQDWRYYIGIMGCSRHNCGILVEECEHMFLINGGDANWLQGFQHIPPKLQKLHKLNQILAHQPWLIDECLLKMLLEGKVDTWLVSELIQAIMILAHYQTLAGFVYGCGIAPEIDMRKGCRRRTPSTGEYSSGTEAVTPTRLKSSTLSFEGTTAAALLEKIQRAQEDEREDEEEENLKNFKDVQNKDEGEDNMEALDENGYFDTFYNKYYDDKTYEEFNQRQKDIDVFRAHDFSWQEQAFSFINRLYPEMGKLLDEKFNCAYNLTYGTMGDHITNVDTSKFRLATWNYIHLVYGIFHDDYVYHEVNKLLEKSYKSYIKKVACYPERITFLDYWEYYTDLLPSEKVHINLLVLESRLQAILLYASRHIMKYMRHK